MIRFQSGSLDVCRDDAQVDDPGHEALQEFQWKTIPHPTHLWTAKRPARR